MPRWTLTGPFFVCVLYVYYVIKSTLASLGYGVLAGISALALTAPAKAAPQTCAFRHPDKSIEEFSCDVHTRVNANGHKVNDITVFSRGRRSKLSIILWKNADGTPDYAEAFYKGDHKAMRYFRANNGMFGVESQDGTVFYF